MIKRIAAAAVALVIACAGCAPDNDTDAVLVLAAASLTDAFAEIEIAFESSNPSVDVQLSFAGSSSLREQILQGAPADVFASANQTTMQTVIDDGAALKATPFASNQLVIAVPESNPGDVIGIEDFARSELFVGLCGVGVPCGDFARQSLAQAGVEPSVDSNESSARALLTKLELGELDLGIVYVTDLRSSGDVVGIALPATARVDARYPIATLVDAPNSQGASAFVDFVLSAEGQSILASHGFERP